MRAGPHVLVWSAAVDQAPGKGHDRWLVRGNFAGVADGATPLAHDWPDAGEFADFALQALATHSDAATVREQWARAIDVAVQAYGEGGHTRSCGVATSRVIDRRLEISSAGDCGAIVLLRDQQLHVQLDQRLAALDADARGHPGELQRLLRNRARMNTPGGYWVFAPAPALVDHVQHAAFPIEDVESVLLFSDGLSRLVHPDRADDWRRLLSTARLEGLPTLMASLRQREAAPAPGQTLLERADDAVAILLEV